MMRPRLACSRLAALALLLGAIAGCSGGSAPTRFYVLTATPGAAEKSAAASAGVSIGIGPVSLPGYLDRPQIVARTGPDSVDLAEWDRWAEPLREGIASVLAQDVAGLVPTERVAVFPWRQTREIRYQVGVEVIRFERQPGGEVALIARWRILAANGAERAVRMSSSTEPAGGGGYPGTVAAMSRLLARLGEEIAAEINRLPR